MTDVTRYAERCTYRSLLLTSAIACNWHNNDSWLTILFENKLLSDVNILAMSSANLISELRCLENYKKTPIIMITTELYGYKKDKLKSLGANGWLRKSFTEWQTQNTLKHLLK